MSLRSTSHVCSALLLAVSTLGCPGPEPSLDEGSGGSDAVTNGPGPGPGPGPGSSGSVSVGSSSATASSAKSSGSGDGGNPGAGGAGGSGDGGDATGGSGGGDGGRGGGGPECNDPADCICDDLDCHVLEPRCVLGACDFTCEPGYLNRVPGLGPLARGCETRVSRVFVTSEPVGLPFGIDADGGAAAAHEHCTQVAIDAELADGDWLAWISDDEFSPAVDFKRSTRPYVLLTNDVVADSWADLTLGPLERPIRVNEVAELEPGVEVWTGTNANGTAVPKANCSGWTLDNVSASAVVGSSSAVNQAWSRGEIELDCFDDENSAERHLYCFEQLDEP